MSESVRFVVVVPAWNCAEWIERSLKSLLCQSHLNYRCVVIDDVSSDDTFERARALVEGDARFTVIRNAERGFPLANIIKGSHLGGSHPDDVIAVLDGDDWLMDDGVLQYLAQQYLDPSLWLTYGSHEFLRQHWRLRIRGKKARQSTDGPYPDEIAEHRLYRHYQHFHAGHLRTYRYGLFCKIREADLKDRRGIYWPAGGDAATMWPMLEMAGPGHSRHVSKVLYVYNNGHALAENRPEKRREKQVMMADMRSRPRYQRLENYLPET